MAIPYHAFAQIAQAYGGIDPTDLDAVGAFFEAIPHRIPPARWPEVVEKLLAHEGEPLPPEYQALFEQDAARSAGAEPTKVLIHESKPTVPSKRQRITPEQLVARETTWANTMDLDATVIDEARLAAWFERLRRGEECV